MRPIIPILLLVSLILSVISISIAIHVIASDPEIVYETTSEVETPSLPEETEHTYRAEISYTFYDVPFDTDTQKDIMSICTEYDLEYELILGMISEESTFRSEVIGDGGDSYGLMQIQPKWWRETMEAEGITDLTDPLQNIRCGCAIVRHLIDTYSTEYRALQAYNTGNPNSSNGYADRVYNAIDNLSVSGYSVKLVEVAEEVLV